MLLNVQGFLLLSVRIFFSGDVATLTYGNIDLKRKIITQFMRKSRKIFEFPLSNALLAATQDGTLCEALLPSLCVRKELFNGDWQVDEKRLHSGLSKPRRT